VQLSAGRKNSISGCIFPCDPELGRANSAMLNPHHKTKEQILSENQLIEEARKDPARFGLLYEKYYRQIFIFVFRRTGDEDIAGDIVADAFLKAMVALPKYEFKGLPFSSWLFRIALNEVNMFYRKDKRERNVSLEQSDLKNIIAEAGEDNTAEADKMVMQLLSSLTPEEMQFIELRFFEKRAFAEVADILGITENNAKVRTYRILDKLKVLLNKNSTN